MEEFQAIYTEEQVPAYTLPELLVDGAGQAVKTAGAWSRRREALLEIFAQEVYGYTPKAEVTATFEVVEEEEQALEGMARRRQVRATFTGNGQQVEMDLLLYLPLTPEPAPLFLGLNFSGNQTIYPDPAILLSERWMRENPKAGIVDHRATEASRGIAASRWDVSQILSRGYGLGTIYCGDLDPDYDDGYQNGIHPLFYRPGQSQPDPDQWGTIGAWAWGLSRAMDYLQATPDVDGERVALLGHSRLGKTALWAGVQDERFGLVISNNSGCGGAALSRRAFGETVGRINTVFPHWFCDNFRRYNQREDELPVDQHMLLALVAPRPLYVASAVEDLWADPRGEFLAAVHASPAYEVLGLPGLGVTEMPAPSQPIQHGRVGYHIRPGGHDVTSYDWRCFLDFADYHL